MSTIMTQELRTAVLNGILSEAHECQWTLAARFRNTNALNNVPNGPFNITLPEDVDEETCSDSELVRLQLDFLGLGG